MGEKIRKCCGCIVLPYLHESVDGRYRYQCQCGYNSRGRLYVCTTGARNGWNRNYAQSEATVLREQLTTALAENKTLTTERNATLEENRRLEDRIIRLVEGGKKLEAENKRLKAECEGLREIKFVCLECQKDELLVAVGHLKTAIDLVNFAYHNPDIEWDYKGEHIKMGEFLSKFANLECAHPQTDTTETGE